MSRSRIQGSPLWRAWLETCRLHPERVVIIDAAQDFSWTAEALTTAAKAYEETLAELPQGALIAFSLPNSGQWMAFFLALQRANLAAVPLDAGLPKAGALEMARRVGACSLYFGGKFHVQAKGVRAPHVCCVKITSGSDGMPKAISCRAGHLLADGRQVAATMRIRPLDRNLGVIPLGHSYGLGNLVMPLIQQGTAIVTAGEFVPRQLVEWTNRYGVSVMPLVPAVLRALAGLPAGPVLSSVRTVISAGAVLSPEVAQIFFQRFGLKIHNFYGSSETGGIAYDRTGNASLTGRSVGRALEGVSIAVTRQVITVQSPAVATRTGRWRLGDLGALDRRGELNLLGRVGQEANVGGKKVHPREIERVLRGLPKVTDASVWLHQGHGRDLLAAAAETTMSRAELESALGELLPAWKVPRKILVAPELPRTARGKLDGPELRRRLG